MTDPAVWSLVHDLTAALNDRMSKSGHPYALVFQEHRGVCPPYECSARCQSYRALFVRAQAWLEANESQPARQLALVEGLG